MGQIVLPKTNQTGTNEWVDVQDNDDAIIAVVNGDLDNSNIASGANIAGSKLATGGVDTTQLADDAVTRDKLSDNLIQTKRVLLGASELNTVSFFWDNAFPNANYTALVTVSENPASTVWLDSLTTAGGAVKYAGATTGVMVAHVIAIAD